MITISNYTAKKDVAKKDVDWTHQIRKITSCRSHETKKIQAFSFFDQESSSTSSVIGHYCNKPTTRQTIVKGFNYKTSQRSLSGCQKKKNE